MKFNDDSKCDDYGDWKYKKGMVIWSASLFRYWDKCPNDYHKTGHKKRYCRHKNCKEIDRYGRCKKCDSGGDTKYIGAHKEFWNRWPDYMKDPRGALCYTQDDCKNEGTLGCRLWNGKKVVSYGNSILFNLHLNRYSKCTLLWRRKVS